LSSCVRVYRASNISSNGFGNRLYGILVFP
jgi:hypothetical protein